MEPQNLGSDGLFGWGENYSYDETYDSCSGLVFRDDLHRSPILDFSSVEWQDISKEADYTNPGALLLPNQQAPATWACPDEQMNNLTAVNEYDNSMPGVPGTAYHHNNLAWDNSTYLVMDLEGHCPDLTATTSSAGWSSRSSLHESAEAFFDPLVEHGGFMQRDNDSSQWVAALPTSANHMVEAREPFTSSQTGWSSLSKPDIDNIVVPLCPANFEPLDGAHFNSKIESVSVHQPQPRALLPKIRPETPAPQKKPRRNITQKNKSKPRSKKVQCKFCSKPFPCKRDRDRHYISQHREMAALSGEDVSRFLCSRCGDSFSRQDNRRRHMRRIHDI